mmetsp:Transcript_60150/g.152655  ORF Transcript_60150/g.152655 Transcript_60150/m.152655 type:complete len:209 (+) Transcript_60150:82-708(+)
MLRADAGVLAVDRWGLVAPFYLGRQGGALTCLGRARFHPERALPSGRRTTRMRLYSNETGTPTLSGRVLVSLICFGLAVTRMPRSCAVPHVRVLVAGQPGLTGIFAGCRWALCGTGCGCATFCRSFRRQLSRGLQPCHQTHALLEELALAVVGFAWTLLGFATTAAFGLCTISALVAGQHALAVPRAMLAAASFWAFSQGFPTSHFEA